MSESPAFFVHEKADSDLEQIFDYSVEHFGFSQAVRYIRDIEAMFRELALNPRKGKRFDPQMPRCLTKRVESHLHLLCANAQWNRNLPYPSPANASFQSPFLDGLFRPMKQVGSNNNIASQLTTDQRI